MYFRILRNPFQDTFINIKLPDFTEPNRVVLFHAIETTNNRLFRQGWRVSHGCWTVGWYDKTIQFWGPPLPSLLWPCLVFASAPWAVLDWPTPPAHWFVGVPLKRKPAVSLTLRTSSSADDSWTGCHYRRPTSWVFRSGIRCSSRRSARPSVRWCVRLVLPPPTWWSTRWPRWETSSALSPGEKDRKSVV